MKNIIVISFSEIRRDARVLREIKTLLSDYNITVVGFGNPPSYLEGIGNLQWLPLRMPSGSKHKRRVSYGSRIIKTYLHQMMNAKKISGYEAVYWNNPVYLQAFNHLSNSPVHLIHANDWNTLPLAAEAAHRTGARLVFDAHEYAPLEWENRLLWKLIFPSMIRYWLAKYASSIDAFITVEQEIGVRYQREYGWEPVIIRNIPEAIPANERKVPDLTIHLIHHGGAVPDRKLEAMIQTIALCDDRFHLHFMLTGSEKYIRRLMDDSARMCPGRITFHNPVPTAEVVKTIRAYDLGFYLLEPNSYNNRMALPNKLFDFIAAGLGIVIGPSPAMARLVQEYHLGCVAPSFQPADVARLLNSLDRAQIQQFQHASIQAAKTLNAEIEMQKLTRLYHSLLES